MTDPEERLKENRVYRVEGGRVCGDSNRGGVRVCGDSDQQKMERDYHWYCRRGTDRSGGEWQRICQRAVLEEVAEVVAGSATLMATAKEVMTMMEEE